MNTLKLTTLLIVLLSMCTMSALAGDVKKEAGYIDLSWITIPDDAEEIQDMELDHVLKSVATDAKRNGDTELAKALSMVRSIRLKSFSMDENSEKMVSKAVARIKKQMVDDDWNRLMYMKDKGEEVSVHTKYDKEGNLVGLMFVAIEAGERATFGNVVGDLDLATLMHLIGSMEGDGLEEYLGELEGVKGIHID